MREILFRGKARNTSDRGWAYGSLQCVTVDSATIGQYTGLTDKNGKKIFEGDIVDASLYPADGESEETHKRGVVVWDAEDCAFEIEHKDGADGFWWYMPNKDIEVIGNIHDNPELMEQEVAYGN